MSINGQLKCWFCAGEYIGSDPYHDTVHYATNAYSPGNPMANPFAWSQRVLCPSSPGPVSGEPSQDLCTWDYPAGPDTEHACDPSVVLVNGTYYSYYTAVAYDAANNWTNNIFLARSSDGINWTKYPSANQPPTSIVTAPFNNRYGAGEASVVYKDGTFYLYYFQQDWFTVSNLYLRTSTNGINFGSARRLFSDAAIPETYGAPEVRYLDGWNVWLMLSRGGAAASGSASDDDLHWNLSRDGVHWLPIAWKAAERTISLGTGRPAHNLAIIGTSTGHLGDGGIGPQTFDIAFGDGDPFVLDSDLGVATVTFSPQPLTGWFDGITADKFAHGWAYDPDTGTNDAASNGEPFAALGHSTFVSVWVDGQPLHNWQPSQLSRCDVRDAGMAPDCYHGFSIDLKPLLTPGTHTIQIEGGEFPSGGGGVMLGPSRTISIP